MTPDPPLDPKPAQGERAAARGRPDRLPAAAASARLKAVKVAHTIVWAFFAGCILAIPVASLRGEHGIAAWLSAIVAIEVVVLAFNQWRCPLTSVAARYTEDRHENFDIYLPRWLARNNKLVFGTLYLAGVAFAMANWVRVAN